MNDNRRNTRILVVDDEEEVQELLKDFLEIKGFSVTTESNGLNALEHIAKEIPDIIIMDLLLPGEHGLNLVRTIKEKYFIPIIIISGIYNREEIEDIMEEYFVEDFMRKPPNLEELVNKINKIIHAKSV